MESEKQARLALDIFLRHHPGDHPDVFSALLTLTDILYQRGKLDESLTVGEEALGMVQRLPDAPDERRADALYALGATLTDLGRLQEGERSLRQAASIIKAKQGDHSVQHLDVLSDLQYNLTVQTRFDESIALSREVLAGRIALLGKDHPQVAVSESNLAWLLGEAYVNQRGRPPEPDPDYGLVISAIGRCMALQGKVSEAETYLAQARNSLLTSVRSVDARRHELTRTAEIYDRLHRPTEAALYRGALARLEASARATIPNESQTSAEAPASPDAGH